MRIFYDHQIFSLQSAGGGSRYFYELMRYLAGVPDVKTEALLGIGASALPFRNGTAGNLALRRFAAPVSPGMWLYMVNEVLSNGMAPFLGKADVYHSTLYRRIPLVRARRTVVTHHDCTHERFPHITGDAERVIRAKKLLYAQADAIICVSESCRQDLLAFYPVATSKTRVIHHGLSHLPRCAAAAGRLQSEVRRPYLLYVGSRALYKNYRALLQAFKETRLYQSLDLLVLGGGPPSEEETAIMTKLELSDSIISVPTASDELLAEAYAAATLFVYPSLWEGFGFPPLEAMDAGCPVLASNTSSLPEVCRDAPFYFNPGEEGALNAALLLAINDQPARQRAIERGRAVAAGYSWETCGRKTLELYRACQ